MGSFPSGPDLSAWLDSHFLCTLPLFTVDFPCAKMGERLANTQYDQSTIAVGGLDGRPLPVNKAEW